MEGKKMEQHEAKKNPILWVLVAILLVILVYVMDDMYTRHKAINNMKQMQQEAYDTILKGMQQGLGRHQPTQKENQEADEIVANYKKFLDDLKKDGQGRPR